MNQRWEFQNYNMVVELDIAGEFIYNGIQEINRLSVISNDGPTFIALYNISVGIERLQKIVYVLWGLDDTASDEEFEKSLITHSHTKLRDEICQLVIDENGKKIVNFCGRENEFFVVLQEFYNTVRYMRFNINKRNDSEIILLKKYLEKYVNVESECFVGRGIVVSDDIKELLGRVIGSISVKYYTLVRIGSERNHLYTHELRTDSKAEKVFRGTYRKNSLIEEQLIERISFKELMIYLRQAKDTHAFLKYIDSIEPLEFETEMTIEYLKEIANGIIPQMLIDDVETLYEEQGYSIERVRMVDMFANPDVWYDYSDIKRCGEILYEASENSEITQTQIKEIREHKLYIIEDEIRDILDDVEVLHNEYMKKSLTREQLKVKLKEHYAIYKEFLIPEYYDE